jgi:2-oxoglutarate ferredoxin oxidoreductase subunit gamma
MINSSLIFCDAGREDVDEIKIPANDMAIAIGNIKAANIVALGAFAARSKMVDFEILQECVKAEFAPKAKLIPLNMAALEKGREAAEAYRPASHE